MNKCQECNVEMIASNGRLVCPSCGLVDNDSLIFDSKPVFVEPIKPKAKNVKEFTKIQKKLNVFYIENDELIKKQICSYIAVFNVEPKLISENINEILKLYKSLNYKLHTKNEKILLSVAEFLLSRDILFDFDSIESKYDGNLSVDLLKYFGRKTLFPKARWLIRNVELHERIKSTAEKLLYRTKDRVNFGSAKICATILTAIAMKSLGYRVIAKRLYENFNYKYSALSTHKKLYLKLCAKFCDELI